MDTSNVDEAEKNETQEELKTKFNILCGVGEDLKSFMQEFKTADSVRFEAFSAIWREKKFSFIFWGLFKFHEHLEFTEEIFKVALAYTQPPNPFHTSVAGIYLLYALYLKQPTYPKVRIRVTVQQWRGLQDVLCLAYQQSHHDLIYVFRLLQFRNAFDYVAIPYLYSSPWPQYSTRKEVLDEREWKFFTKKSKLTDYFEEGHLDILSTIHSKYEDMKTKLKENKVIDASSSASLSSGLENISSKMYRQLLKFRARKDVGRVPHNYDDSSEDSQSEDENSQEEMEKDTSVRARLKNEIYSRPVGMSKSRVSRFV